MTKLFISRRSDIKFFKFTYFFGLGRNQERSFFVHWKIIWETGCLSQTPMRIDSRESPLAQQIGYHLDICTPSGTDPSFGSVAETVFAGTAIRDDNVLIEASYK